MIEQIAEVNLRIEWNRRREGVYVGYQCPFRQWLEIAGAGGATVCTVQSHETTEVKRCALGGMVDDEVTAEGKVPPDYCPLREGPVMVVMSAVDEDGRMVGLSPCIGTSPAPRPEWWRKKDR